MNDTGSSIHKETWLVHQKEVRGNRLFLNCAKFISVSSKSLLFSLQMTNMRASGATFHARDLLFHMLRFQVNIKSFTVPGKTQYIPNQHKISHHTQCYPIMKEKMVNIFVRVLTRKIHLLFLAKITHLVASKAKKRTFLGTFRIQIDLRGNEASFITYPSCYLVPSITSMNNIGDNKSPCLKPLKLLRKPHKWPFTRI